MQRRVLSARGLWPCLRRRFVLVSADTVVADLFSELGFENMVYVIKGGKGGLEGSSFKRNEYMARCGLCCFLFFFLGAVRVVPWRQRAVSCPLLRVKQATIWIKWRLMKTALKHFEHGALLWHGGISLPLHGTGVSALLRRLNSSYFTDEECFLPVSCPFLLLPFSCSRSFVS